MLVEWSINETLVTDETFSVIMSEHTGLNLKKLKLDG